ncbi:MAG: acyltransferase [Egibacteraceae bacterium]
MRLVDRLVQRALRRPVAVLVRQALDEQWNDAVLYRHLVHGDPARLHVDPTAVVNNALFNLASGDITVGRYAFFGHNVAVLTGTHDIERFHRARQKTVPKTGRDVVIGDGAWLASHTLVFGPSVIGEHAVVAGGSLVLGDVPPYTVVAGRPAEPIRAIDRPPSAGS